jgi:uncharacterized membrane protein
MSEAAAGTAPRNDAADRTLAAVNYALLFAAVFCVGVPALVAAVLAYARRPSAAPAVCAHF